MLHKVLSEKRRSLGISIDQVVELSGVPKGTVAKVLSGATPNPNLETVKAIAYALGLTLGDLNENRVNGLSDEALRIAMAYDALNEHGKALIDSNMEFATRHFKNGFKEIPVITAGHDADIYARHFSKREQQELAEDLQENPE